MSDTSIDTRGAIDCDGHVLEPIEAMRDYLDEPFRDKAIRLEVGDDGLEYFYWGGKKSTLCAGGFAGVWR